MNARRGLSEGILALYCGGSMYADLRVCNSVLHVSTTEGLRDSYLFGGVNNAALAEAEVVTAPAIRPAPAAVAALDAATAEDLE